MKRDTEIWKPSISANVRHMLYQLGGGQRDYVDIGYKARACVNHDRRCAEIMRDRENLSAPKTQ